MQSNFIEENNSANLPFPSGIYYGQYDRLNQLNTLIYDRNVPTHTLPSNMDARSIPTRNTLYPMNDIRLKYTQTDYLDNGFYPMQSRAPPSGFKIDTESQLRNQFFALQHGANQGVYIPASDSDLYKIQIVSRPSIQPNPYLFEKQTFDAQLHPNVANTLIGRDTFFNNTRTQLRNSV
jgi:hypothetical protein